MADVLEFREIMLSKLPSETNPSHSGEKKRAPSTVDWGEEARVRERERERESPALFSHLAM